MFRSSRPAGPSWEGWGVKIATIQYIPRIGPMPAEIVFELIDGRKVSLEFTPDAKLLAERLRRAAKELTARKVLP